MKAFLGMGHLGSNFVKAMLRRGDQVQVWNRTAGKAQALEAFGAKAFNTPGEAVKGAHHIHLTLKDDASVDEILGEACASFEPGAIIMDHTTTSVEGAKKRTDYWKSQGFTYIHAPVFMGPGNAHDSTGYMLVSGDQEKINIVEGELAKMTGKLINLGAETGKAAGMKLIGNLFLIAMTGGIADTLAMAKASGITAGEIGQLFDLWNPGTMLPMRLKKMAEGNFEQPSWELNMARKDAGLMMSGAQAGGMDLFVIPAVAAVMDEWIAKGNGHKDWTIIGKNAV